MFGMQSVDATNVNRIAVRLPNWLGDAVMATPALQALHQIFPNAPVTILVREQLAELFTSYPFADEVIPLPKVSGPAKVSHVFRVAGNLRRKKFDLAVCFPHSFSSALMFRLAGIPHRLGYFAEGRKIFLTKSLPYPLDGERPHRVKFYLQLLEHFAGKKLSVPALNVWPRPLADEKKENLLRKIGGFGSLVAVAAGSVGLSKRWFSKRYAEIVQRLVRERQVKVVLVGAPHDRPTCDQVAELSGVSPLNLSGETSLSELFFVFQKSRLFLGNDSGAGHLAAAAGVPVVILAGAGDPDEIAPWTDKKTVLFKKIFCSPCYRNTCRRKDHPLECMDLINVDEVRQAVEHWLKRTEEPVGTA